MKKPAPCSWKITLPNTHTQNCLGGLDARPINGYIWGANSKNGIGLDESAVV